MPANAECRRTYSKDMCARSLEIADAEADLRRAAPVDAQKFDLKVEA